MTLKFSCKFVKYRGHICYIIGNITEMLWRMLSPPTHVSTQTLNTFTSALTPSSRTPMVRLIKCRNFIDSPVSLNMFIVLLNSFPTYFGLVINTFLYQLHMIRVQKQFVQIPSHYFNLFIFNIQKHQNLLIISNSQEPQALSEHASCLLHLL